MKTAPNDFTLAFEKLRGLLLPYAKRLTVKTDKPDLYYIEGGFSEKWKRDLFFASVQVKKNYVSFYLMPVYMYPGLLAGISPELKKHMQGKSCFNFKTYDKALFDELKALVKQGFTRFIKEEFPK